MPKVLLITGGSRGIGAATAVLAAKRGYTVCLAYRQQDAAAEQVVKAIRDGCGNAIAVQADVAQQSDVENLFNTVDDQLGRLDALVNNAGILEQQCRVEAMSAERLQRVFSTNVIGAFNCARQAISRMSTRHQGSGGCIVNVSSVAARLGSPGEYVDYAASKGAIDTFTIGLSKEVAAEGIRVNAVRPGYIHTEIHAAGGEPDRVNRMGKMLPLKRGGEPREVAEAILWLLSDEAAYCTGSFIDVAGGV